jgi:hypothetical protein
MTTHTTFTGTPDELKTMLLEVIATLVNQIRKLEIAAGSRKHASTVAKVAQQIGYHRDTVLDFITMVVGPAMVRLSDSRPKS